MLQVIRAAKALLRMVPDFHFVRTWNSQLDHTRQADDYSFRCPAAFVEIVSPSEYEALPAGFTTSDIAVLVHIIHEHYNAIPEDSDPAMEEDEVVFGLRDKVIAAFVMKHLPGTGPMTLSAETQDYDHDNLYHYQVLFKASFIDDTASIWNTGVVIKKDPPTNLELNIQVVPSIQGQPLYPHRKPPQIS